MAEGDKIVLRCARARKHKDCKVVRIDGEASVVLGELYRATGLPLSYIASQMIIQGARIVEISEFTPEKEE